jgi:hypothetical protein
MADIKMKYPASSTGTITCDISSLASSTTGAGRASTAVDNSTNLDFDHLVSGKIKLGSSPAAGKSVSVYAYAPQSISSGTPTYPDGITGTDAAKTMTSVNVMAGALRLLWVGTSDATSGLVLYMPPTSIAQAFGMMPRFYGLFVTHDTSGTTLDATASNHQFQYERCQHQVV